MGSRMDGKELVHNLFAIAQRAESSQTTQVEQSLWATVKQVCNIALEASFYLSETLQDDGSAQAFAARKFLENWDGRS